ncbi:MAG: IS3 family transposase, partial [Anaerolineae bacterium]|nr:IS3 family transposase [Anaerolineae bacterium]
MRSGIQQTQTRERRTEAAHWRVDAEHAPAKKVEIVRRSKLKSVCADALGISRKNIYRQLRQPAKDLALKAQIEAVHHEHPAYGHRRVALHLKINHKRAQRVMAKFKLKPPRRRVKRYSTVSTSQHSYKNLLKNRTVTRPHQVWCSDLSRILYRGTLWYIATIEDLFTRQIIAQRMGKRHDSHLVLATLRQALATGYQPQVFHSDQGNEFMAQRCTDYLEQRDILVSVSDVASPWQNGYIESFFGRFKHE